MFRIVQVYAREPVHREDLESKHQESFPCANPDQSRNAQGQLSLSPLMADPPSERKVLGGSKGDCFEASGVHPKAYIMIIRRI